MPTTFARHETWQKRSLAPQSVALWYLEDSPSFDPETAINLLSESERTRANHFKALGKRREYILGRWFMRHALAQYLEVAPGDLDIRWAPGEKPRLFGQGAWQFNLSHSHGAMTLIISPQYQVGVDIEFTKRKVLPLRYDHAFTSYEQEDHQGLATRHGIERFFLRWTLKEALWKAIDSTEYIPFNGFEIRFDGPLQVRGLVPHWPERPRDFRWESPTSNYLVAANVEGVSPGEIDWQFHTFAFLTDIPAS